MPLPRNSRIAPSNNARFFFSKENSRQMSRMSHFLTVKNCRIFLAHTLLSLLSLSPILLSTFQFRRHNSSFSHIRNAKEEKGEHCISPFYHVSRYTVCHCTCFRREQIPAALATTNVRTSKKRRGKNQRKEKDFSPFQLGTTSFFLFRETGVYFAPKPFYPSSGEIDRLFPTHVTQHQEKKGAGKWREIKVGQDFGRRLFLPLVTTPTHI